LIAAWCPAPLDAAVSVNILSLYNRFGVDAQGNILIAANPASCTLPTVKPLSPCGPLWIGKLDPSGQILLFATYLGNQAAGATAVYTQVAGVTADAGGNLIVAAHTVAPDLPTVKPFQDAPKAQFTSLYVAKLAPDGSRLLYATYLGGSGAQSALSLAVDAAGAAYVAATTTSPDFPSTPSSVRESPSNATVVAKLSPDGQLQYADTFPFEFYTEVKPIQLDAAGRAILVSNAQVLEVAPDGSSLTRTPLPAWTTATTNCVADASGGSVCPAAPWVLPRAAGGFQFAGTTATGIPVTPDGLDTSDDSAGYARIEAGQATHPQLPTPVNGFAVDPQDHNRAYAATGSGLFGSTDNGRTWVVLHVGPALAIAIDPFDSKRLYLSVDGTPSSRGVPQLFRSTDRGMNWSTLTISGTVYPITSFAADPHVQDCCMARAAHCFVAPTAATPGTPAWLVLPVRTSRPRLPPAPNRLWSRWMRRTRAGPMSPD
jgi:hypothetical protein